MDLGAHAVGVFSVWLTAILAGERLRFRSVGVYGKPSTLDAIVSSKPLPLNFLPEARQTLST